MLTPSQLIILWIINEQSPIHLSKLLNFVQGTKSNISQRLNFLIKKGFISKKSGNDKRSKIIEINVEGKKILKKVNLKIDHYDLYKSVELQKKLKMAIKNKLS